LAYLRPKFDVGQVAPQLAELVTTKLPPENRDAIMLNLSVRVATPHQKYIRNWALKLTQLFLLFVP